MIPLQEIHVDFLSFYLIEGLLTLPEGWREADDIAVFKKGEESKFSDLDFGPEKYS